MAKNEKRKNNGSDNPSQGSSKEAKVSIDKKVYTIWNNKGGVGKTTLTFHIATQYAKSHPTDRVVVIDMCPQSNVSTALLGCASEGESELLSKIKNEKVKEHFGEDLEESQDYFKSISGYLLMKVHNKQPQSDPTKYLVKVNDHNENIPGNLFLLLGDDTLELTIKQVEYFRNKHAMEDKPWKEGTLLIRTMIDKLANNYAKLNVTGLTVFIDTNPAFSVYTELAVAAADRLITPVNADDFSRAAVNAMLANIYGYEFNQSYEDVCFREQKKHVFSYRAPEEGLVLPKLHLAINNRVTLYNLRSSITFSAMGDCVVDALYAAYKKKPEIFSDTGLIKNDSRDPFFSGPGVRLSKEAFKNRFFHELKDFHKTAVHSIHSGTPLFGMHSSSIQIGETKDKVASQQVASCLENIKKIVEML